MRYPDATSFPGMIYWAGSGGCTVKLTIDGKSLSQPFLINKDPRISGSIPDLQKQFDLSIQLRGKVSQTNDAVI